MLHVGIWKRRFYGNAGDHCLGSDNSSVVILTGVSTVITKGPLNSNGRGYKSPASTRNESSLALTAEESACNLASNLAHNCKVYKCVKEAQ
jgi:hypothetical protein